MGQGSYSALVVDSDAAVRRLLVGALAKLGFECDDAADGEHATRLTELSPYDVVITDLKLPKKHGHALSLELLQQASPPLIIVHSAAVESRLATDLLLRGVDDIVYKPTDLSFLAAKVKAMVERRAQPRMDTSVSAVRAPNAAPDAVPPDDTAGGPVNLSQLNTRLANVSAVMPVSHAALDVYEMTRSDDWDAMQIAAAILRDASLAIEVLRLANSCLYNPSGRRIANVDEAVARIGQKRVGELALAANALSMVAPAKVPWMDLELAWKRSMAAGIAVESLVELGGHQAIEDGLLLSAIMHPLGRVALAMMFPNHYQLMIERCGEAGETLREEERRIFPTNHTEVMAHLLASWRIPPDVFLPLKFSLDDFSSLARRSEPTRTISELVKVGILVGRLAVGRWEEWDLLQFPSPRVMQRLRVKDIRQVIHQTKSDLEKLAGFHPGGESQHQQTCAGQIDRPVPYCNLSGNKFDLFVELLPALGLQAEPRAIEDLKHLDEPSIVNCLDATPDQIPRGDGWKNALFVADQESHDVFESFGRALALPTSFARFRDQISECVPANTAELVRSALA